MEKTKKKPKEKDKKRIIIRIRKIMTRKEMTKKCVSQ